MKLELNLMELNTLYFALYKQMRTAETDAKKYGGEYFNGEFVRVKELLDKVNLTLIETANAIDASIDEYRMEAGQYEFTNIKDFDFEN